MLDFSDCTRTDIFKLLLFDTVYAIPEQVRNILNCDDNFRCAADCLAFVHVQPDKYSVENITHWISNGSGKRALKR